MKPRIPDVIFGALLAVALFGVGAVLASSVQMKAAGLSEFWNAKITDWITGISTVVLVALNYSLAKSTAAMSSSSDKHFSAVNRPWLRTDIENFEVFNREAHVFHFSLKIKVTNIGSEPATRCRIFREVIRPHEAMSVERQREFITRCRATEELSGFFLFPRDERLESFGDPLQAEDRETRPIIGGAAMMVCVVYDLPGGTNLGTTSFVAVVMRADGNFDLREIRDYSQNELTIQRPFNMESAD